MPTPSMDRRTEQEVNLATERLDADLREAEARLEMVHAQAKARKARDDMNEISGLTAKKDQVKRDIAALKQRATANYAGTKHAVEQSMKELQAGIRRLDDRFTDWDAARERHFSAKLDEADAKLKLWEAETDRTHAERAMKGHDALATLRERIALARARAAEARQERFSASAQKALNDAARHFNEAFNAASSRYEKT